jgi:hypothetical protein
VLTHCALCRSASAQVRRERGPSSTRVSVSVTELPTSPTITAARLHLGHCSLTLFPDLDSLRRSYGDVPTTILTDYLTEATPAEEDVIEYVAVTTFSQLVS